LILKLNYLELVSLDPKIKVLILIFHQMNQETMCLAWTLQSKQIEAQYSTNLQIKTKGFMTTKKKTRPIVLIK